MALAINTVGSAQNFGGTTSPASYTGLTIPGSLSQSGLIAYVAANVTGTITATWNGVACTSVGSYNPGSPGIQLVFFGLLAPASGAHTLSVAFTGGGSDDIYVGAMVLTGLEQSAVAAAFTNSATFGPSTSANATGNVTSAVGNIAFAQFSTFDAQDFTGMSVGTQRFHLNANSMDYIGASVAGAATATLTAINSAMPSQWIGNGVQAVAAASATAKRGCRSLGPMMGVGCGIWAAKKIEENPIITRRRLLLPR